MFTATVRRRATITLAFLVLAMLPASIAIRCVAAPRSVLVDVDIPPTTHFYWYGHRITGHVTVTRDGRVLYANELPSPTLGLGPAASLVRPGRRLDTLGTRLLASGMTPEEALRHHNYRCALAIFQMDSIYYANLEKGPLAALQLVRAFADTDLVDLSEPITMLPFHIIEFTLRGQQHPTRVGVSDRRSKLAAPDTTSVLRRTLDSVQALSQWLTEREPQFIYFGLEVLRLDGDDASAAATQVERARLGQVRVRANRQTAPRTTVPGWIVESILRVEGGK